MLASFRQTAPFNGRCKDANVADLLRQCGAGPDQRRRIDDRPPKRSFVGVEPAPENVKRSVFRSAYKEKSTLASGEPRRRSFFMIDPLKIILVAASRRHRHGSERCAGLAAMEVVAGTVFCLSNPASPRLEKGLKVHSEGTPCESPT